MPAPSPNWTGDESQLPHWPTATFSTSAADAVDPPDAIAASVTATQVPNRTLMATSRLDLSRRDVRRLDNLPHRARPAKSTRHDRADGLGRPSACPRHQGRLADQRGDAQRHDAVALLAHHAEAEAVKRKALADVGNRARLVDDEAR